jgi:hypothetical protein
MHSGVVTIAGTDFLLFDVGGVVAIAGLVLTFVVSTISNTRALYVAEPLPPRGGRPLSLQQPVDSVAVKG